MRELFPLLFRRILLPQVPRVFDPLYNSYWKERINNRRIIEVAKRRIKELIPFLDEDDSILDIGCGTGIVLRELIKLYPHLITIGIDVSSEARKEASSLGVKVLELDLSKPEINLHGEFDHILLFEVLEHIHDAESILLKVREHYHKGIYVTIPNSGYILHRLRLLFGKFPVTYQDDPREHIRFWTVSDFKQWIKWLGFKECKIIGKRGRIPLLAKIFPSLFASDVFYMIK